jgi:glyoxylase-like metal-dependent hydrolase (beta-lactamase superfamily II)
VAAGGSGVGQTQRGWSEVGDRVLVRRFTMWGDEPFDQNVGVLLGRDGLVVVDTRASYRRADELLAELHALSRLPIAAVVNTHHHWDHTFGNTRFLPAPIWAHRRCAHQLREQGDAMRARVLAHAPEIADELEEVVLTPADRLFDESAILDLGDRQVDLTHIGRGHTDNDIVVGVADAGVLFAGDLLENTEGPGYRDAFPSAWAEAVGERLLPMVSGVAVPGHGGVVDPAFVAAQATDLRIMAQLGGQVANDELDEREAIRRSPFPAETAEMAIRRSALELATSGG